MTICRHLGRVYNLYGDNEKEKTMIDMLIDGAEDLKKQYFGIVYNEKALELVKEFNEITLPKWCDYFEFIKEKNNGDYFVGNRISIADIIIFDILYMCYRLCPTIFTKFPKLESFMTKISSLEWYKTYLKSNNQSVSVNTDKASLDNTEHPLPWIKEVTKYH